MSSLLRTIGEQASIIFTQSTYMTRSSARKSTNGRDLEEAFETLDLPGSLPMTRKFVLPDIAEVTLPAQWSTSTKTNISE